MWWKSANPEAAAASRRAEHTERTCVVCETTWLSKRNDAKYCSDECKGKAYEGRKVRMPKRTSRLPADHPVMKLIAEQTTAAIAARNQAQRSPLLVAVEDGDWSRVIEILMSQTKHDPRTGCWTWTGQARERYGRVKLRKRTVFAHRLMAQAAANGADPGPMPVHHKCGNSLCISADHLQVVTPIENTAEMLERRHYLRRIAQLERALARVAPDHPALAVTARQRIASHQR